MKVRARKTPPTWLVLVLFGSSAAVYAQSTPIPVKPGLWEMQTSVSHAMALPPDAEAKIAALPAAQQAQVRAMMSGGGKPAVATRQVCFAGQASMDSLSSQIQQTPGMQCNISNKAQTAHGASYDISCTGTSGTAQGHTDLRWIDDSHISGTSHMTIAGSAHGTTTNMTVDSTTSGKFVNADCGDVKPLGATVPALK